ncbi:MAG: LPS-assembly protein LptD [Candidatus Omnitrophica bacterium]|nr:LPS-assembly protein LptD [Candidatus Omnitrophota bacterium]
MSKDKKDSPVVVDADDLEYSDEEYMIIGKGNVKINYSGALLKADQVKVNIKTKETVASGNVSIVYEDITICGQNLFYNFETKRGTVESEPKSEEDQVVVLDQSNRIVTRQFDFDLEKQKVATVSPVKRYVGETIVSSQGLIYDFSSDTAVADQTAFESFPWYGKAQTTERINKELLKLNRGYLTTCELEKPHYRLQAKRIFVYIDDKIVARNVLLFVGNMPVFYYPYWKQSLKETRTNVAISAGHNKKWGWFMLTSWRYYLNDDMKAIVHLDERELKGFASGVDLHYSTEKYGQGVTKTYFMNERDKDFIDEKDKKTRMIEEKERYRAQVKHKWKPDDSTLALFEYNKMSDIDFVKDYLYREYEEDIQPISETSLTHYEQDFSSGIYARKRTNRFYSEVERLPELTFDMPGKKIQDTNFYFREELALVNLNKKNAGTAEDTDVNRIDSYSEFKYPTKLPDDMDWINFTPYLGTRQTFYSKDRYGNEENFIRGIHYYGGEMNTKFFRFFDCSGRFMGVELNRLRHVVTPIVRYDYLHSPTVQRDKLGEFDGIDSVAKLNYFTLGVENHLQTKWKKNDSKELEDINLIYFYPYLEYMHVVEEQKGQRHFSYINGELDIKPFRWLDMNSDLVYDQYKRRFNTANIDIAALSGEKWRAGLGKRYQRDVDEQLTADIYYKINDNWQARSYARYLSYEDVFQEQQYTIYRDLHCWFLELTYDIKTSDDHANTDFFVDTFNSLIGGFEARA